MWMVVGHHQPAFAHQPVRRTKANLVWKDTVFVKTGETVDILLDVAHPASGWLTATSPSFEVSE